MTTTTTAGSQARPELTSMQHGHRATPPHWHGRLRTALRAVGLSVLMLALGYGGGWLHARGKLSEMNARLQSAESEHRRSLSQLKNVAEQTQDQRDQLAELIVLYDGLRGSRHALDALDSRNFGIAQSSLRSAQQALATVNRPVAGLDALRQQLARTDVTVASNIERQRQELVDLARGLDGLVARERALMVDLLPDGDLQLAAPAPTPAPAN